MKNKEITIYDLMGLIKDGKAPKKIKIYDDIFELSVTHYYLNGILEREKDLYYKISGGYATLNDTIEILSEENDEWEDIKEIDNSADDTLFTMECYTGIPEKAQDWNFNIFKNKINQLIKNQRKIIEKLESKDER